MDMKQGRNVVAAELSIVARPRFIDRSFKLVFRFSAAAPDGAADSPVSALDPTTLGSAKADSLAARLEDREKNGGPQFYGHPEAADGTYAGRPG